MNNSISRTIAPLTMGNGKETAPAKRSRPLRIRYESLTIETDSDELADIHHIIPGVVPPVSPRSDHTGNSAPTRRELPNITTKVAKQKSISPVAPQKRKPVTTAKGNSSTVAVDHSKDSLPEFVKELNENHFVSHDGSQTRVYRVTSDPRSGKRKLESFSLSSFGSLYRNQFVEVVVAGKVKLKPKVQEWLSHPGRRQYDGIVMAPLMELPGYFNRYMGLAVEPVQGSWELMQNHMLNNICANNMVSFNYLMGWLATMIQRPGEPGQVAIVLIGGRGTGKGALGNCLCDLMGHHSLHATGSEQVTGKFNGHLEDTVFIYADEANFAGTRQGGVLKAMITEPELPIQGKYKKLKGVPNMLHIIMASNDDWVVPTGNDERRYCVLNVSDARQQDLEYFGAISQEMKSGGLAAMLFDLLKYDLSGFEVRRVPQTQGLLDQIRLTREAVKSK